VKRNVLEYAYRPTVVVVTLILVMFIAIFAQFLVTQLLWLYTYEKPSPPKFPDDQQWRIHRADKLFLPDATLHLGHRGNAWSGDDYAKVEITDVNGSVLWQGIRKDRPFKYLEWASFAQNFNEQQMRYMFVLTPDLPAVLEVPVRVAGEVKDVWRYDFEAEAFAGYEVGGGLIGYLGADGFAVSKAQIHPFGEFKGFAAWTDEDPSAIVMLWQTKRCIYQLDFRSRKVETLFDSAQSDIEFIQWHKWRPTNPRDRDDSDIQYRPLIDCRTADQKHHLIMREPNQILTVETPRQWIVETPDKRQSDMDFTATGDAVFLRYREEHFNPPKSQKLLEQYNREYESKPQPQSIQLYKVAGDGKLELVSRFDWTKPVPVAEISYHIDREKIFLKWASKTSPPAFDLLMILFGDGLYKFSREGMGLMQDYVRIIIYLRPGYSFLNYVLSAAMAAFALWHGWARRTSWGKLILWLIVVGAFNLAGLLTYLGLNHTPVIKCPVCGKKRGLETPNCIRCGGPLPIPQRKPTDLILAT